MVEEVSIQQIETRGRRAFAVLSLGDLKVIILQRHFQRIIRILFRFYFLNLVLRYTELSEILNFILKFR